MNYETYNNNYVNSFLKEYTIFLLRCVYLCVCVHGFLLKCLSRVYKFVLKLFNVFKP